MEFEIKNKSNVFLTRVALSPFKLCFSDARSKLSCYRHKPDLHFLFAVHFTIVLDTSVSDTISHNSAHLRRNLVFLLLIIAGRRPQGHFSIDFRSHLPTGTLCVL